MQEFLSYLSNTINCMVEYFVIFPCTVVELIQKGSQLEWVDEDGSSKF